MASAPSASSSASLFSCGLFLIRPTQPPTLKPSSPAGSWTTPSSETLSLMMIFPILVSTFLFAVVSHHRGGGGVHLACRSCESACPVHLAPADNHDGSPDQAGARIVRAVDEAGAAAWGNWARAGRPVRPLAGAYMEKSEQIGGAARCGKQVTLRWGW